MAKALEILGYQHCAHGLDQLDQPDYVNRWYEIANAKFKGRGKGRTKRSDWDELLGHCAATTDMPCATFWRELREAYPEAKIILVERDEDKWFKSFSEAVIAATFSPGGRFNTLVIEPLLGTKLSPLTHMLLEDMVHAQDAEGMRRNARAAYRQHYADVRAGIPAKDRLDYQLGSGWAPICEFLGKPIPDEPFPWINETAELHKKIEAYRIKMQARMKQALLRRVLPVVLLGSAIIIGWRMRG